MTATNVFKFPWFHMESPLGIGGYVSQGDFLNFNNLRSFLVNFRQHLRFISPKQKK